VCHGGLKGGDNLESESGLRGLQNPTFIFFQAGGVTRPLLEKNHPHYQQYRLEV
jgi:hypothetical protein